MDHWSALLDHERRITHIEVSHAVDRAHISRRLENLETLKMISPRRGLAALIARAGLDALSLRLLLILAALAAASLGQDKLAAAIAMLLNAL